MGVYEKIRLLGGGCGGEGNASLMDKTQPDPCFGSTLIKEMFRVLDPCRKRGRMAFLLYHVLYDYPPGSSTQYAKERGISADVIASFVETIGLRKYGADSRAFSRTRRWPAAREL